jgi:uncharacterized protein YyaL (SSP411 family)
MPMTGTPHPVSERAAARAGSWRRLILIGVAMVSCSGVAAATETLSNRLEGHPSPYLALHAQDPVAWQEWDERAIARARAENKLLYLSIGYFSCHWCHVMQRESYRDGGVAAFLNANFIPVKVDRELETALDARMIEFAQATQGRAGWPLNVFLTPEGFPLYAVLYLPRDNFMQVLQRLQGLWRDDHANLSSVARREASSAQGPGAPRLDAKMVDEYARRIVVGALEIADPLHGGFGDQNKFPMSPQLDFLLAAQQRAAAEPLAAMLELTLDGMARNGLYDHLGGGFFRYTVDPSWETPHFEKMLYDNAQLALLYLRAADVLQKPEYRLVARETLDFMARDMMADDGALVASFSAVDANDVEGGYYLWDQAELARRLTKPEQQVLMLAYRMQDAPTFDAGWLPMLGPSAADIAVTLGRHADAVSKDLERAQGKLRQVRSGRTLPVDSKLLAGWNGLALTAFATAAQALEEPRYRETARAIRDYLVGELWDGKQLLRAVRQGRVLGRASIEDYAYVGRGLYAWAQLTARPSDMGLALAVAQQAWERFYGPQGWRLTEHSLIAVGDTHDVIEDGPMPSPSGVITRLSLALAAATGDEALRDRALGALNSGHDLIAAEPFWYASQVLAMVSAFEAKTGTVSR